MSYGYKLATNTRFPVVKNIEKCDEYAKNSRIKPPTFNQWVPGSTPGRVIKQGVKKSRK